MRKISSKFLLVAGLMMALGMVSTAFASTADTKRPKNTGILSVKTDEPMTVFVDGVQVGMSGVGTAAEFYVTPGTHQVEVVSSSGQKFEKEYTFTKNVKNCICLKTVKEVKTSPCPYDMRVDGPNRVTEGDLVTFAAFNAVAGSAAILNYVWKVSPDSSKITSGQGTSSITVDTNGLGGQTLNASLEVGDDTNTPQCRQRISVPTFVEKPRVIEKEKSRRIDRWGARSFDDDKARLDRFAIELQNTPGAQGYIVMYQGTGVGMKRRDRNADYLGNRALNYLVKTRGVDPSRLGKTNWGTVQVTTYELWIIPPGADPPVPGQME